MARPYTPGELAQIAKLLAEGKTCGEIARLLDRSYRAIEGVLRRGRPNGPNRYTRSNPNNFDKQATAAKTTGELLTDLFVASSPACDCPTCRATRAVQAARAAGPTSGDLLAALARLHYPRCGCPICVNLRELQKRLPKMSNAKNLEHNLPEGGF